MWDLIIAYLFIFNQYAPVSFTRRILSIPKTFSFAWIKLTRSV